MLINNFRLNEDIGGYMDDKEDEYTFRDNVSNLQVEFSQLKGSDENKSNKSPKSKNSEAFSCSFCMNKFQNKKLYMKHLNTHPEYKKFFCNYCAKSKHF